MSSVLKKADKLNLSLSLSWNICAVSDLSQALLSLIIMEQILLWGFPVILRTYGRNKQILVYLDKMSPWLMLQILKLKDKFRNQ